MTTFSKLSDLTLDQARTALDAREYSTVELAQTYLVQIEKLDPHVNALLCVNPDALELAEALDQERAKGAIRGPLHGMPLLLKDNIDTGDRMATTAGSLALQDCLSREDAFVVKQLRRAGALILGKTNLSEWANFRSTRSSTGWSSLGGQTLNAYDTSRSPGGSSSGSGSAVALGMCAAALGTETDGSVVIPSAMHSLVGFKPSVGLVGRSGIIPISHSQDTAGPMTRTVTDAALLLSAMIGADPEDTLAVEPGNLASELLALDAGALKGARIGVDRTLCGLHEGVDEVVDQGIIALQQCGAGVVDDITLSAHDELDPYEDVVLRYEFKAGLNRYLEGLCPGARLHSLESLIEFNIDNADLVMPYFGQEHFHAAQASGSLDDAEYRQAKTTAKTLAGRDGIDAVLETHRLDALFGPTIGPPWTIDLVNGDHRSACISSPAAVAGYPHITVPGGFVHDLPVGVSFYAGHLMDAKIVRYAYAFEQQTQLRRVPPMTQSLTDTSLS